MCEFQKFGVVLFILCCLRDTNATPLTASESNIPLISSPDSNSKSCGIAVPGQVAEIYHYPWLALIEYLEDGKLKTPCGGTLISSQYVLTAGHCVTGSIVKTIVPKNVRLGEFDTSNDGPDCITPPNGNKVCTEGTVTIPIEKVITHPQYVYREVTRKHDIALVRMQQTAPYTDFIRPICLPTIDVTLENRPISFEMAGWGTETGLSSVRSHVDLPLVSLEKCQSTYSSKARNITLWKGQVCAGGEKGKDSCQGDGGMPLMYKNGKTYEVFGLVSFGASPCGRENFPSVYTNVYEYKSWIDNIVN